jgi:predicted NAD/FAD-binding protein
MIERKKIAIIGGGASGLVTGYLLNNNHDITLYEKESIIGGNVRTLNKNVSGTSLPKNINIENGVLGFSQNYYPKFHQLLNHLGTTCHSYKPSISLFKEDLFYPARTASYLNLRQIWQLINKSQFRSELLQLIAAQKDFKNSLPESNLYNNSFGDYCNLKGFYQKYLQALFMLSFSTPSQHVQHLPQTLLNPYLKSLPKSTWSFVKGGVYTYMETILQKSKMNIICNAKNLKISRNATYVTIKLLGEAQHYDIVIIATTPGSVKELLTDMTDAEGAIFNAMHNQNFKTIVHSDLSFYGKYEKVKKTPMDLFIAKNETNFGYNTYQNDVYKLPSKTPYSFAYNLDDVIAKDRIIHQTTHNVPLYGKNHDTKIQQIKAMNGQNRTFYVGAYLENGLHEGAVESAIKVASKLGGRIL